MPFLDVIIVKKKINIWRFLKLILTCAVIDCGRKWSKTFDKHVFFKTNSWYNTFIREKIHDMILQNLFSLPNPLFRIPNLYSTNVDTV